jgi:hypothetical protein
MAENVKTAPTGPKPPQTARITLETTEAEVIALDADGKTLVFDEGDFKRLPDAVIHVLSHENAKRYWMTFGAVSKKAAPAKAERLEILDPLQGQEDKLVEVKPAGPRATEWFKRWWPYWALVERIEVARGQGYTEVTEEEVKANDLHVGVSPNASGYYTTKYAGTFAVSLAGKEESRLMKIPLERYREHMKKVSLDSEQAVRSTSQNLAMHLEAAKIPEKYARPTEPTEDDLEGEAAVMDREQFKGTKERAEGAQRR